ncbi:MAG: DUF885 domain-containing protein [Elusimicrobiota bacterium]
MNRLFPLCAVLLAAVPLRAGEDAAKLFDDYWAAQMRHSPLTATYLAIPGYDDQLDDNGPDGRAARKAENYALLKRARSLRLKSLSREERLSVAVMKSMLQNALEKSALPFHELDINHLDGGQSWIPVVIETSQPMKDESDAAKLEKRLKAIPLHFIRQQDNLRAGLDHGRVAARVPVEKVMRQIEEMLALPLEQTPYARACDRLPEALRTTWTPRLLSVVQAEVRPALRSFVSFLKDDYLPQTRTDAIGLSAVPGGGAMYRHAVVSQTTVLDRSAEDLHQLGLTELDSISVEIKQLMRRAGHAGDLESFYDSLRSNPKNFFATREEVLSSAEAMVAKARTRLPAWFDAIPQIPLVVKPVEDFQEKNQVAAYYFPPSEDLSRPGVYYVNTYQPSSRPRYGAAATAVHEGLPGHHLQIASALENKELPAFRRHADFVAYTEGWALYAERLGDEMGLYEEDLARLGMLSNQALRAARLIVDTGLHDKSWTRRQAIEFLKTNTPLPLEEIEAEVDRYTVWPGQALAYKVGQIELMDLREEVASRMGRRFDIKAFHAAVLRRGPLPLPILREEVRDVFPRN